MIQARLAFQRFVDAIHTPREAALLEAALGDGVVVDRHAPGARDGEVAPVVEQFTGRAAVTKWLLRTPARVVFTLLGEPWRARDGDVGIRYAIAVDDFRNEGIWLARLDPDGRIAHLAHRPFALSS